jgi:phosphate transport system permease protein
VTTPLFEQAARPAPAWARSQARRRSEDRLIESLLGVAAVASGAAILLVIVFVLWKAYPLTARDGLAWLVRADWDGAIMQAWGDPGFWRFGALSLIIGTVATTVGALALSVPLGIGCAIVLSELASDAIHGVVESVVRLLSGVPSVIFGLVGLTVAVPLIQSTLISEELGLRYIDVPLDGQSLLAGIVVLTFMIVPFVVAVSADAMRAVPDSYRLGGLALGLTRWRTIVKLVIPPALPGIIAGTVLAAARGGGEAIAMAMVAGALANIPRLSRGLVALLEPVRTLASAIVENGEGMSVPQVEAALFSLGATLLLISIAMSIAARVAFQRLKTRAGVASDRVV